MKYQILTGDNRVTLKTIADNSIDAIVTDPPYGIDFLGKSWDANTGAIETYQECLRAFSAARTYHHLAVTLEQAGFEIRDQIMWIYSSGFPKSQDIGRSIQRSMGVKEHYTLEEYEKLTGCTNLPSGKDTLGHYNEGDGHKSAGLSGQIAKVTDPVAQQWSGWGTQLKPAHEPIALARKPIKLSIAKNCQTHGVGALNIDATRVGDPITYTNQSAFANNVALANNGEIKHAGANMSEEVTVAGRFPSNVIGEIAEPYQKYFYCPKVSRKERHIGHPLPGAEPLNSPDQVRNHPLWDPSIGTNAHRLKEKIRKSLAPTGHIKGPYDENGNRLAVTLNNANLPGNNHPTVKPIELMKYLIKLITPPGGTVLDPFNGSGSTGCAAVELHHPYIGCELDPVYVAIAERRIAAWYADTHPLQSTGLFE